MADVQKVECPVCARLFKTSQINSHVNNCLNSTENNDRPKRNNSDTEDRTGSDCQPSKKQKTGGDQGRPHESSPPSVAPHGGRSTAGGASLSKAWSFMKSPPAGHKNSNTPSSTISNASNGTNSNDNTNSEMIKDEISAMRNNSNIAGKKQSSFFVKKLPNEDKNVRQELFVKKVPEMANTNPNPVKMGNRSSQQKNVNVPLPERLRPKTFTDYIGQNKVIGKNKLLRTLLESDRVPSMILWGPPGCGKVIK